MSTYLYKGFGATMEKTDLGFPGYKTDVDLIADSIDQIIMTGKGERIMRPDFGADVYKIIFDNDARFIRNELISNIVVAIKENEPRAKVTPADVIVEINDNEVILTVNFAFLNSQGQVQQKIMRY